ncbi:MAG: GxxExxY protein [Actinobacteria bacterium]|nr:GxxExxY protein [Actinomycetota bacterium]
MLIERELTEKIIGAAIEVHKYWGPGLYEEIYEKSLCRELDLLKISHVSQLRMPLEYKGLNIGDELRCDVFVDGKVVVEIKAVNNLLPVHDAQLLTYMKLLKVRVGLLINFNVDMLTQGIRRMVL